MTIKSDYMPRRVGAVVIFDDGMSATEASEVLLQFGASLPEGKRIKSIEVDKFDPDWGSPVFYVP